MNKVTTIQALRAATSAARAQDKRIALVPTMGNLHAGHLALVQRAQQQADFVITSIFVNPLQFGATEDLARYPRTLAADQAQLSAAGCDLLFYPDVTEMYPQGMSGHTHIQVPRVSETLCGNSRPGHFSGMATIVCKLLNMAQPDLAIFGEKDFQQLTVIRKFVQELNLPVHIIAAPTVRAADGLALSSRNQYLTAKERAIAPALYQSLGNIGSAIIAGARNYLALAQEAQAQLSTLGFRPEYLVVCNTEQLQPAQPEDRTLVIAAAAFLGNTRLIDNVQLTL